MLSHEILEAAVREAGLTSPVHYHEVAGSTNALALELAEAGAPEWTVVGAGHQTTGRGRLGRAWVSEPGGALLFSFVLRPELPADRAALVTLLAGASMATAAGAASGLRVRCKWPNDLVVGDAKVGGILAEASVAGGAVRHVVVGIGVNVAGAPEGVEGADGLGGADPAALLTAFLVAFRREYLPAAPDFPERVLAAYRLLSATIGRRVRAQTTDGRTIEGQAEDVDAAGNLVVATPSGPETVGFGEVLHLR